MTHIRQSLRDLWGKDKILIIRNSVLLEQSVSTTAEILRREPDGAGISDADVAMYIHLLKRSKTSMTFNHICEGERLIDSF